MPTTTPARQAIVDAIAGLLSFVRPDRVLRVAVDGPDAAGKTTLADDVAGRIGQSGRPVIRVNVDDFHHPPAIRRRRGPLSAQGYFLDAFDYDALRREVLDPLGPRGDRRYRTASFDHRTGTVADVPLRRAPSDAVLLLDGVFLLREELRGHWDLSVHLTVSPRESLRRALVRDLELFGSAAAVRERYLARYLPGQELYQRHSAPHRHADILIDNEEPYAPRVLRWPDSG